MLYSSSFHCATFPATLYIADDCIFKDQQKMVYYFVCPSKEIEYKRLVNNIVYVVIAKDIFQIHFNY